jgi:aspartate/methionine/tyrosine aminotransferase
MISKKLEKFGTSVFTEFSALATQYNATNLSQGFPNFEGPKNLKDIFAKEILSGWNQYVPSQGILSLREKISEYFEKNYGLSYNPETEITVTHGATEALFASISGIFNENDEIIVFEPFYDSYVPTIELIGSKAVAVRLSVNKKLEKEDILAKISEKTRGIILNTPHNPTGKIFSDEELTAISEVAIKNNLTVLSDEVYEQIVFDGNKPKSISQLKNMRERTVVISSIGKSFSFTGWKVGWVLAPENLTKGVRASHQFTTFCTVPAAQKAAEFALSSDQSYFDELSQMYQKKRDFLVNGLKNIGFDVQNPTGTYFLVADYSKFSEKSDYDYARELTKEAKVGLIPTSAFYLEEYNERFLRFCFAKSDEILEDALEKLQNYLK